MKNIWRRRGSEGVWERTYESGKGKFEKEEVGGALIPTDFAQCYCAWTVTFDFAIAYWDLSF